MNLGEFRQLLERYLKRQDLRDLYNPWFRFTSKRIDDQLRLKEQEYRAVTTPIAQYISLPPDFIEMRALQTNVNGGTPLLYMTAQQLDYRRLARALSNNPQQTMFYTILDNQLEIIPAPTADNTVGLEMIYFAELPDISQADQTNKVLTAYPNLYLYGCMYEAACFLKDEQDKESYATLWRDYAKELNDRQQAGRYSGSYLRMRAV